ncbi:MAG: VTT domain-containing protein [Syntrophales bacterium]|nr:VTT domain-containing protein [Syntrophales bacterium]
MPQGKVIAVEGINCWRRVHTGRAAFLVDAKAYFEALVAAARQARQSILIAGWDIDSRLELKPDRPESHDPARLGEFLNNLVSERNDLHIYILTWDFAMIYLFEREFMPLFKLNWRTRSRIHVRFDGNHPLGASHHQKIVVVDDSVAFSGGFDLTARRWDTPEHRSEDPYRIDPWGAPYHPFHDVQIMVEGEAAACLGEIFRERWRRATGRSIPAAAPADRWPPGVRPDIDNVQAAIARTFPKWGNYPEVREVERLFIDMLSSARKSIYIENQYFTSSLIGNILAGRLRAENGPEIVMIVPARCSGWLEQNTMGIYRDQLLRMLRKADISGRLRVYSPALPGLEIHSKVLIVDDELLRIGSANMSNRSMGLDTECDLMIEAGGESRVREAIVLFRRRLIGEHLGTDAGEVAAAEEAEGSLVGAVESIRRKSGKIRELEPENEDRGSAICDEVICDPEKPMNADYVLARMLPEEVKDRRGTRPLSLVALLAALGALAAVWHWSPLGEWIRPEVISSLIAPFRENTLIPFLVPAVYALAGLVIPITILIISTVLIFDPLYAFFYSLIGCLSSASLSYGIGQTLGRDLIRRIAGKRANRVSRHIVRHGFFAVILLRVTAIAPFTVINLIAGASRIRFRDYFLGTLIGEVPGVFALTLFGDRLGAAIRYPNPQSLLLLAGIVLLFLSGSYWLTRHIARKEI